MAKRKRKRPGAPRRSGVGPPNGPHDTSPRGGLPLDHVEGSRQLDRAEHIVSLRESGEIPTVIERVAIHDGKVGHPRLMLTESMRQAALKFLERGQGRSMTARNIGIGYATFRRMLAENPDFLEEVVTIERARDERCEMTLLQAGATTLADPDDPDGKDTPGDGEAAKAYLNHKHRRESQRISQKHWKAEFELKLKEFKLKQEFFQAKFGRPDDESPWDMSILTANEQSEFDRLYGLVMSGEPLEERDAGLFGTLSARLIAKASENASLMKQRKEKALA